MSALRENEKEILGILSAFESELQEKLQESKSEVERVKYYEKFQMQGIDFKNIFVTTEKDVDGNTTYHIYSGNSFNEILSIDAKGNINIDNPELKKFLSDIDFEKIIKENDNELGNLKGISEKAEPEEAKKALETEKDSQEQEKQSPEDKEIQKIEEDLKEQGEDLEISKSRGIKDNSLAERMPEVFSEGEENRIAYSNKLNSYVMISKIQGEYKLNKNIEPAKMTWKSVISIDSDGKTVERKVPHALMKVPSKPNKEVAVIIGTYGETDIETVDVLPCQERIARTVRAEGEGIRAEESYEVKQEFRTQGKEYKHDIAHQVEEIEDTQKENNEDVDFSITPEDYIPNLEPKKTWGELMNETGDSLTELIERYNREIKEKSPEEAIETIEQDYGNVQHEHQRR